MRIISCSLDELHISKLQRLHLMRSSSKHRQHLLIHGKKFGDLLREHHLPFLTPYDSIPETSTSSPTFHGPITCTAPRLPSKPSDSSPSTVINLSSTPLTPAETSVLSLGLKFSPKPSHDPSLDLAPRIHSVLQKLPFGMESSATYEVSSVLSAYNPKSDKTIDNMTPVQRSALKSLKSKKSELKFIKADKGNATVVLSKQQYLDKVNAHITTGPYSKLKKDPTSTLPDKLYRLLKKFRDDGHISKSQLDSMRVLHPRQPQLYGQPKIHKPGAPIRPIVSFYNTPLSALHKVLAHYLKPLSSNPIRLKNSNDYKQHLDATNNPTYPYHASLDVKSLYTACNMREALRTATTLFKEQPDLLPSGISAKTIGSLISFCLDNSYFEFDGILYSQNEGGTMGSPLIVELAEIRVHSMEHLALSSFTDPPNDYRHFVDDGIGAFRDQPHADSFHRFMNTLCPDLQYTIEHPSSDGYLPFLDILIHPDKSTSVYRKPTHTNLYARHNSCAAPSTKDSVIRSLITRAYNLCSPQHLQPELQTVRSICISNGHPAPRVDRIMNQIHLKQTSSPTTMSARQFKRTSSPPSSLRISLPYHHSLSKPLKKILTSYDIDVTFSSATTLRDTLTNVKSPTPPHLTPNAIYSIPCKDCPASYIGQTYRPILKRIKEHKASTDKHRSDSTLEFNISAVAQHAIESNHTIAWSQTSVLTTTSSRYHLNLAEHAAIKIRNPILNRQLVGPNIHSLWNPLLPKLSNSMKSKPASLPLADTAPPARH